MSFAFTFTESTSLFTRETSPFRQASKSSLKAPPMLLPPSMGLAAPELGLETLSLLLQPPPDVVGLKLVLLARVGAAGSGEARSVSIPTLHSLSFSGVEVSSAIGAEVGGGANTELFRGGDCKLLCCCCCCEERRGTAITAVPATIRTLLLSGESARFRSSVSGQLMNTPLKLRRATFKNITAVS